MTTHKLLILATLMVIIPGAATGDIITIAVKGVVCAFCAQGITKTFKKEPAVREIKVSLEKKLVTLVTHDGQDISNEKITDDITRSGFNVVSIERGKK